MQRQQLQDFPGLFASKRTLEVEELTEGPPVQFAKAAETIPASA